MKVLFVVPPYPNRVKEYLILPSLDVYIWSAVLKENGHEVDLIDMKIDNIDIETLKGMLRQYCPDIVVIDDDPRTHSNAVKIIPLVREIYGEQVGIAMRGEIATFVPEKVLERNPELDYVIRHDDDYALLKILEARQGKGSFENINNIGYRTSKDGEFNITERKFNDYPLDSLPMPDREIYDISKYLRRDSETIVRSSRGCPSNCLFCIKSKFAKFSLFSVERFCDEIEELLSYGFKSFFFSDDTFAFSDERLTQFANEVKRRNLKFKWTSNIRIKDINDYKIKLMKEIGAYRVFVGVETSNAKTSKVIGKNLGNEEVIVKTDILHKYGMEFHASFILGNPGDTEEDLQAMVELVKRINPTLVTFNLLKCYPGIDMYANPEKYGIILDDEYWYEKDTWSNKVIVSTKDLSADTLEKWSRKCLFEFINI